ncbi:spherulin-2A-like [Ostrinia furnacalis]|uniref:spherulin-2A-like n=1 Tax=Ostrinia furnacalis TaxID=93504 RepID=UPI00103D8B30|nr:spherulin-2A-like [Ostrinia furnacalis]
MRLAQCVLLFICLKVINAKINIDVTTNADNDVTVKYSGVNTNVITQNEINIFRVNTMNLNKALKKYYGEKTSNAYLKSPTPWGDLYKKYHWEQVKKVLSIKSARLKSINMKPVVVMSQNFDNYSNKTIKVNTGLSQTVENTFSTTWSKTTEFTVSQEVEYDVNVIFAKITGTTAFSFTTAWGKDVEKSETITIGTTTNMETELAPGQGCTAVLSANRGYLEVEVVYTAFLRGNVAVNFKNGYKGHHFWGPQINKVMEAGGLRNEITTVETIKVGVYVDSSLKVYDKASGKPL